MRAGRATGLLVGAVLVVALAGGCSSGDDDQLVLPTTDSTTTSSQPPRTTEASTTTTTETPPETSDTKPDLEIPTEWESDLDEIFGRYLLYWDVYKVAIGPPRADPQYPLLAEMLTEEAFVDIAATIQEYRDFDVVSVVPEGSINEHILRLPNPSLLAKAEGAEVVIQDCWVQDTEQRSIDGELVEAAFQSVLFNVTMRVVDGEWRVAASTRASEESSGYQECTDYIEYLESSPPCPQCWPYGRE